MGMTAAQVLDGYFLETRAKLLEIAANMDRMERAEGAEAVRGDARCVFVREALGILLSEGAGKAERIQVLYSKG